MFRQLVVTCQTEAKAWKARFQFKHPVIRPDSTTIPLCVSMSEWAKYVQDQGSVKLHLVLDHKGFLPQYTVLSEGKRADIAVATRITDGGCQLTRDGMHLVSRLKDRTV